MPYTQRIKNLEQTVQQLSEELSSNQLTEKQVYDTIERKNAYIAEIKRLTRLQWEERHERVNFDDN